MAELFDSKTKDQTSPGWRPLVGWRHVEAIAMRLISIY